MKDFISWKDFEKLDIRVGTIIDAQHFEKARNPSYKLWIDFGKDIGIKKTSAQITAFYQPENLIGRQITAIINFPPKQIADFMSECLVLGAIDQNNNVTLITPDKITANGLPIG